MASTVMPQLPHGQIKERTIIQSWQKEQSQLKRDRERMYEQYAPLQDELGQLLMVKHCAEIVMKGGQERMHEQPVQVTESASFHGILSKTRS